MEAPTVQARLALWDHFNLGHFHYPDVGVYRDPERGTVRHNQRNLPPAMETDPGSAPPVVIQHGGSLIEQSHP
jgi:hypothetical protein